MSGTKDIFNLIENPNDLPSSNQGMAEMFYREILPTRNVSDSATLTAYNSQFGGTNISIRWNLDNRTWWIPARSYLKLDVEITKPDGSSLTLADQIAPNMGLAPSLFNRISFKMNDTTVSQISQYIPQCDAISKRIYNSENWMGKAEGDSTEFWNAYQAKRLHDITSNGYVCDYVQALENENGAVLDYLVTGKEELGLGPIQAANAPALTITGATHVLTLHANAYAGVLASFADIFRQGDILLLQLRTGAPANEAFQRLVFVNDIIDATNLHFISLSGIALGNAGTNNDGLANITRFRHIDPLTVIQKNGFANEFASTREVVAATGLVNFDSGYNDNLLLQNDIVVAPIAADANARMGYLVANKLNAFQFYGGETNPAIAIAAANVDMQLIKFSDSYIFTSAEDLGYSWAPAQNNSHSYTVTAAGVLTQFQNGAANVPPAFNDLDALGNPTFRQGDFIVTRLANTAYRYYWVNQVTGANTMIVLGSNVLPAEGANNNGLNYIVGRLRYQNKDILGNLSVPYNQAKRKNKFDICWKPSCLSIFNYPGALPGGTKFELELQALAQEYVGLAVETPYGVKKSGRVSASIVGKDYQVLIKNLKLYICQVQGPVVGNDEYSYYINMNECRAHTRKLLSKSLVQTSLDVTPSSYALALAFQDNRAINREDSDISVTKFHVAGDNSDREELALSRYSIRFSGLSVPQPDAELKEGELQEFLCNQYIRNQMYTNQYFKQSGGESMQDWKERGIYFYHPFVRSAGNREVRAYVQTQFNDSDDTQDQLSETGLNNMQLFLFEFYRAFALVKMRNGFVYNIQTATQ